MTPVRFHKNGCEILSVEDWFRCAPPKKGLRHWKDGRSAKELARSWFPQRGQPQIPHELTSLLNSHQDTMGTVIYEGLPENKVRLDSFKGETRNTDLVLLGQSNQKAIVISIEAKADEPFDLTIAERLRKAEGSSSNVPKRISLLCRSLFGETVTEFPPLADLRYQLLTGMAGALIEAGIQQADVGLFVVHEFISKEVDSQKVKANLRDFVKFIHLLPGCSNAGIVEGQLIGPIHVPGGEFVPSDIPLYIGKISREISQDNFN